MSKDVFKAPLAYLDTTHRAIVARFEQSLRYVSLHHANARTFSYEFASILRDACSAFGSFSDAVVQASCQNRWQNPPNIKDFFDFYSKTNTDLTKAYVDVMLLRDAHQPAHRLQPFWGWTRDNPPAWWTAHNKIKHSEYVHANEGNLQNATSALAAVEIVLRCVTLNQNGTALFSHWGGPWEPGQRGTEHIRLLFEP